MTKALYKTVFSFIIILLACNSSFAHATIIDIEKMSKGQAVQLYIQLGFQHIIPLGLDHILFIIALFIINPKLKQILQQATAFTIAHTITLGLSMYQVINAPTKWVEVIIALSILYVAIENIITNKVKPSRVAIVFAFGLIHGFGFASALSEIGLPKSSFITSLLMFNIGVELGQITVILALYFLIIKWVVAKNYYRNIVVKPLSIGIAAIALFWVVERML